MGKKANCAACIFGADFMLRQVQQLEREIDAAIEAKDIEAVHQIRVASRRLRNAFEHFKDCLPSKRSKAWQDEIRKITGALGRARDLDIQIECVNACCDETLEQRFKPGYHRLLLRLKQRRMKAQKKVNQALDNLKAGDILSKMQGHFEALSARAEDTYLFTPSLYQRAFTGINDELQEFLSYKDFIRDPDNVEKLHAMRITGKHLRYTLELFSPLYKEALIPYIQVMKDIQDQLGAIHDADVWIAWLPKFIEKEQDRIEDYFGNIGPLKRLLPGFNHFKEDRQQRRAAEFQAFLSTWDSLADENAWGVLREIIKTPINVEAALIHLSANEGGSLADETVQSQLEESHSTQIDTAPEVDARDTPEDQLPSEEAS